MALQGLGIPYMGSKRKLAVDIVDFITRKQPKATKLYDIFGGGGAISFTALQFPQFINGVVWNDIDQRLCALVDYILKAKEHKKNNPELYKLGNVYEDKFYELVSREDFFKNKERPDWYGGYIQSVWSFGNKGTAYMFGKEIEEAKRLGHNLAVYGRQSDLNNIRNFGINIPKEVLDLSRLYDRRMFISGYCRKFGNRYELQRLQQLERLERLQQLQQLQRLERKGASYKDIDPKSFEPYSIVYLDPPYEDTADYLNSIDHKELYEWIQKIKVPVYLSSYKSPLKPVMALKHRTTLKGGNCKESGARTEWLFWNEVNIL